MKQWEWILLEKPQDDFLPKKVISLLDHNAFSRLKVKERWQFAKTVPSTTGFFFSRRNSLPAFPYLLEDGCHLSESFVKG